MKRKISSTTGKGPLGRLAEKRPCTDHRGNAKISAAASTTSSTALHMNFSLQVAKHVLRVAPGETPFKNQACSPLSIAAILNVLAAASEGRTRDQLLRVMERDSVEEVNDVASRLAEVLKKDDDEDAPDIAFANALWVADGLPLKEPFRELLRNVYATEANSADFYTQADKVVKQANLWAKEQTKGFINQILSRGSINKDTVMILVNALYFKGFWVDKFDPKYTKKDDFCLLNGDKVQAPFMIKRQSRLKYGTLKDCKVLRMLYLEGEQGEAMKGRHPRFSMYIFLPDSKDGLPDLIESMKIDETLFKEKIKLKYERVELYIPKFNFECDLSLTEFMKHLGLTLPFDKVNCELTRMVEGPNNGDGSPFVSGIIQKCRIEINEKGTKAAALTGVQGGSKGGGPIPRPPVEFVANHPFMFIIREDFSGVILFIGTILDPIST